MGALVRDNVSDWRKFYVSYHLYGRSILLTNHSGLKQRCGGTALLIFVGYRPPKRQTGLEQLSFFKKIRQLDLIGASMLTAAMTLLLAGLSMGGTQHPWASAPTLSTIIIGIIGLVIFCIYEWKGTSTGILHHELFNRGDRSRTFVICLVLIAIEGMMMYPYILFYPTL